MVVISERTSSRSSDYVYSLSHSKCDDPSEREQRILIVLFRFINSSCVLSETFAYTVVVTTVTAVHWRIYSPCESREFRTRGETRLDIGRCTGVPGSWSIRVWHAAKQAGSKLASGSRNSRDNSETRRTYMRLSCTATAFRKITCDICCAIKSPYNRLKGVING